MFHRDLLLFTTAQVFTRKWFWWKVLETLSIKFSVLKLKAFMREITDKTEIPETPLLWKHPPLLSNQNI